MFLTIADKSYPRKLAFSYLEELAKEFANTYGAKVETVRKPYAFVGFGEYRGTYLEIYFNLGGMYRYLYVQDSPFIPRHTDGQCCKLKFRQIE